MQKRKTKLNILDIAILVAILCAVCVLLFQDTISEIFDPVEIRNLEITVKIGENDFDITLLKEGNPVRFDSDSDTPVVADAQIIDISSGSDGNTVTLVCTGYTRLGLIYTENGDRVRVGSDCSIILDDNTHPCTVVSAEW